MIFEYITNCNLTRLLSKPKHNFNAKVKSFMNIMSYSTGIMNGRLKKFLIQKEDSSVRDYLFGSNGVVFS